ncbi:hypothetical protein GCM10009105_30430 [Dokdonella soli]|uniref:Uncharacterized protein n=1 Tax=Dokdonella soli TaxID=529810 RepID=A0ABN1IT46_9GAMM
MWERGEGPPHPAVTRPAGGIRRAKRQSCRFVSRGEKGEAVQRVEYAGAASVSAGTAGGVNATSRSASSGSA